MLVFTIVVVLVALLSIVFLQRPKFGKRPSGERLRRTRESPNYRNGQFHNEHPTPDLTEGVTYYAVLKEFLFKKSRQAKPGAALPSNKTNLLTLDPAADVLVWFGHSSYFLQIDGRKILVDPVLSGAASPIRLTTRSFKGTDVYTVAEIPDIDYLFITHDHWDHLDYDTIKHLKTRIRKIVCGLGTGEHFEHWGFEHQQVIELDWHEYLKLEDGFSINSTPARHFSGRGLKRNTALWLSFVFTTPTMKLFIGGDSGYDTHFSRIGNQFGPFDLAILECGQYDKSWKYIHMLPDEIIKAAADLKAKHLMPVHWGKFLLANHAWKEPIVKIAALSKLNAQLLVTPLIGATVPLKNMAGFTTWWEDID